MSMAAVDRHPIRAAERGDPRWDEAVDEHRTALAAFIDAAERLRDGDWRAEWAPGKWTRAQVAEHLALAYEAAIRELTTGQPVRVLVQGWRQRALRWVFLPQILFRRAFPVRARSPREIRPGGDMTAPRAEVVRRVRELGERFEAEMERARAGGGGSLTHPYFGRLPAVKAMRFVAIHLEHHTRQIAKKA